MVHDGFRPIFNPKSGHFSEYQTSNLTTTTTSTTRDKVLNFTRGVVLAFNPGWGVFEHEIGCFNNEIVNLIHKNSLLWRFPRRSYFKKAFGQTFRPTSTQVECQRGVKRAHQRSFFIHGASNMHWVWSSFTLNTKTWTFLPNPHPKIDIFSPIWYYTTQRS
jgi:hypothetical protein